MDTGTRRFPREASGDPSISFPGSDSSSMDTVRLEDTIDLENSQAEELRRLLVTQNISLKPNELVRIRELFGRNPTLVELHIFNIMWSEH